MPEAQWGPKAVTEGAGPAHTLHSLHLSTAEALDKSKQSLKSLSEMFHRATTPIDASTRINYIASDLKRARVESVAARKREHKLNLICNKKLSGRSYNRTDTLC